MTSDTQKESVLGLVADPGAHQGAMPQNPSRRLHQVHQARPELTCPTTTTIPLTYTCLGTVISASAGRGVVRGGFLIIDSKVSPASVTSVTQLE